MHRLKVLQFNDSSGRSVLCKTAEQLLEFLFNMEQEIWKDIWGYEGLYQVSNLGNVKSLFWGRHKTYREKILKKWTRKSWHEYVILSKNNIKKNLLVSRLVAITFIPNPENKPIVCHKDETLIESRLDNSVDNLWWWTYSDNFQDMISKRRENYVYKTNNPNKGKLWKLHHCSKAVIQYDKQMNFIREWHSMSDVKRELWINAINISCSCRQIKSRLIAGWFIWRYKI